MLYHIPVTTPAWPGAWPFPTASKPVSRHNRSMLVLASASPRRRELLAQTGFSFEIHPAQIPEEPKPGEDPIAYVTRLAREKAQAVFTEMGACR